ncbi:MAG: PD40 domain-containing protein [Bacteroidales bacterium]|nr:PD40 domain-containing protein [Bacteroidales bacterium]
MVKVKYILIIVYILFTVPLILSGQDESSDSKKLLKTANQYFDDADYKYAIKIFLIIDSIQPDDPVINYKIGACYLNSEYEKVKAIPYLEFAKKSKYLETPKVVYKDLGILYHLDCQFDKSIDNFNKYLKLANKNDKYIIFAKRMLTICENAKKITSKTYDVEIENLGYPISTKDSEFSPLISADESILYFMRKKGINENYKTFGKTSDDEVQIMYSLRNGNLWYEPKAITFPNIDKKISVKLAGLSPDGEHLFFHIGKDNKGNIYTCLFVNGQCTGLKKLSNNINSKFWEDRVSITPNGRVLYFSSNRPGGFGGKDLYKVEKNEKGNWDKPINLGSQINTKYNEISPFIHPDAKTLYFSSDGHNTIGGYDIFKSTYENKQWTEPENIGYPNTTKDDIYFVLSADGQTGYFSSSQNDIFNNHHIYKVNLKKSIPLTLVKGIILAGVPLKPIKANIKVVDKQTNERIKYIYSPNPETGKYLMIFPPGKNYDMIIESNNFLPQLVNIYIPNQTYFYELFQEIHLTPIETLGGTIGEEITVNNIFYDIYKTSFADSILGVCVSDTTKDYGQLLQIVEDLINTTDSLGIKLLDKQYSLEKEEYDSVAIKKGYNQLFNMVEKAIETTDSVSLAILDENTLYNEEATNKYFYALDDKKNNLIPFVIENDTIYTTPPLNTERYIKKSSFSITKNLSKSYTDSIYDVEKYNPKIIKLSKDYERKVIIETKILFDKNSALIKKEYYNKLNEITELIINNRLIGIEIFGYADSEGTSEHNLNLSKQRANSVLKYLFEKGISTQKAILKGYGESKSKSEISEKDRIKNRRVDIKVFEVIK